MLRVTGFDIPYPPPKLEHLHLPGVDRVLDAVDRLQCDDEPDTRYLTAGGGRERLRHRAGVPAARPRRGADRGRDPALAGRGRRHGDVDQIVVEVETAKAAVEVPSPFAGTVVRLYGEPGSVVDVGAPLIAVSVADETYREEERAGSGNVLIGYGTSETPRSRRRAARARTREAARPAPGEAVRPAQAVRPTSPETVHPAQAARPAQAEAVRPTPPEAVRPASPEAVRPASSEAPRVISPVVRRLARAHSIDVAALTPSGPGGVVLRRDIEAAVAATTPANGNGNGKRARAGGGAR